MKKLFLITGAAIIALPAVAAAEKQYKPVNYNANTTSKTYNQYEPSAAADDQYRLEVKSEQNFRTGAPRPTSYNIMDGQKLEVKGDTVYKITAANGRFYAPNGSYETTNGLTIVVEDGQLVRIEDTPEVVAFGMYGRDNRR